jgi:ribose transport system substrate-binding protein
MHGVCKRFGATVALHDVSREVAPAQGLEKGEIHGLVLQDPINMGHLGVKTMVWHLIGEKVQRRIDTGSVVATPENMSDPKIKELLEPDFKKWLKED